MKRAIVIPSFKAETTLAAVIESLPPEVFSEGGVVVIVHDYSPDGTGEVADSLAAKYPSVFAVHHEVNRGYGGALKTGVRYAIEEHDAELFAIVHSDGQYAPELVLRLCEPIEKGRTEIVQGSRMKGGARSGSHPMPWSRYLPNRVLTTMENLVVGTRLAEFHSGYMVYSRRLMERVPFEALEDRTYTFDAEMIILAHMAGIQTVEVPIPTKYDEETSSLDPVPYGLSVLRMMWRVMTGHYLELMDLHSIRLAKEAAKSEARRVFKSSAYDGFRFVIHDYPTGFFECDGVAARRAQETLRRRMAFSDALLSDLLRHGAWRIGQEEIWG